MESPDCSAEQVSKANVRLAIDLATKFVLEQGLKVGTYKQLFFQQTLFSIAFY